jgi:amidase
VDATDLCYTSASELGRLYRSRELSPVEATDAVLARIERLNPKLNAFLTVTADLAREQARASEARALRGELIGPLDGIPYSLKDLEPTAGIRTTFGSRWFADHVPTEDGIVAARLKRTGAVLLGKTNTPHFGYKDMCDNLIGPPCSNPWRLDRTSGASSGGAGSAVAAGLGPIAHGSDGAGSIRIPSSCCGVFGLKTQRGRISIAPHEDGRLGWHGLSVYGPIVPTVRDAGLFLDATAAEAPPRPFAEAATRPPDKLRVALSFKHPPGITALVGQLDPEVRQAIEGVAEVLRSLGHEVVERDPDYGLVANNVVVRYLRGIHDDAVGMERPERLERRTRGLARLGGLFPDPVLARARAREATDAARIGSLFSDHDVLLTPVLTRPPIEVGHYEGRGALWTLVGSAAFVAYAPPWNALGNPAAAVPAGFTASGLPVGAQLVGRPHDEATLLSLSAQIEAERPWGERLPAPAVGGAGFEPA